MQADIYFRTALSGYNKADVMRFIEKLNKEQVDRVSDLNDRIRTSQAEVRRLNQEIESLKRRCEEAETLLSNKEESDAVNEEKAQKFDSMQRSYADIMLDAESSAKEKILSAKSESDELIKKANSYFENKKREAEELNKKLIRENKAILDEAKEQFASLFDGVNESFEKVLKNILRGESNE